MDNTLALRRGRRGVVNESGSVPEDAVIVTELVVEFICYLHWIVCILVIKFVAAYNIIVTHFLYLFFLFLHLLYLTL